MVVYKQLNYLIKFSKDIVLSSVQVYFRFISYYNGDLDLMLFGPKRNATEDLKSLKAKK